METHHDSAQNLVVLSKWCNDEGEQSRGSGLSGIKIHTPLPSRRGQCHALLTQALLSRLLSSQTSFSSLCRLEYFPQSPLPVASLKMWSIRVPTTHHGPASF